MTIVATATVLLPVLARQDYRFVYALRVVMGLASVSICTFLVYSLGSTSTFKTSCGSTALDMPEWREMTQQIDWRAKQPSQVACFSEDLKFWAAWDTTCGNKAKDITPWITWRREAWKEEALDDLPWKDERGPSSPSDEHWNCFKGNVRETAERRGGAHMAFSESIYIYKYHHKLNWTELVGALSPANHMSIYEHRFSHDSGENRFRE